MKQDFFSSTPEDAAAFAAAHDDYDDDRPTRAELAADEFERSRPDPAPPLNPWA